MRAFDDQLGAALLAGLTLGLAWAPFWLGGNRPLAWGVNGLFFPFLALCYEGAVLIGARRHAVALKHVAPAASLFALALIWIVVQISTAAPTALAHPIWGLAREALERPVEGSISVNRTESIVALTRLLTAASVFWLALQLSRNASRAHFLLGAIAGVVSLYAVYGLILAAFFGGGIPFLDALPSLGGVRSTFVNRNHFATYAGLGLVAVAGLATRDAPFSGRQATRSALLLGAGVVILAALLGSASRGGVMATVCGLASLLALLGRRREAPPIGAAIAMIGTLAIGITFFSDAFMARLTSGGLDGAARLPTYAIVLGSIRDNPILGLGYGTFADAFPLYRDQSIPTVGLWDKAHNTYLEIWQGLGLIFGSALIGAVIWLAGKCFAGALNRRRDAAPPAVAVAASVVVGVHALVDFSVQIEAVALTYMAILGAGVAQSESSRSVMGDSRAR